MGKIIIQSETTVDWELIYLVEACSKVLRQKAEAKGS